MKGNGKHLNQGYGSSWLTWKVTLKSRTDEVVKTERERIKVKKKKKKFVELVITMEKLGLFFCGPFG